VESAGRRLYFKIRQRTHRLVDLYHLTEKLGAASRVLEDSAAAAGERLGGWKKALLHRSSAAAGILRELIASGRDEGVGGRIVQLRTLALSDRREPAIELTASNVIPGQAVLGSWVGVKIIRRSRRAGTSVSLITKSVAPPGGSPADVVLKTSDVPGRHRATRMIGRRHQVG
jgi:hypothetical protein